MASMAHRRLRKAGSRPKTLMPDTVRRLAQSPGRRLRSRPILMPSMARKRRRRRPLILTLGTVRKRRHRPPSILTPGMA